MDKKPSFLERLTGALEKDEPEEQMPKNNDSDNDEDDGEETSTGKNSLKAESDKSKFTKAKKISLPAETEKDEEKNDWLPEAEGQLTIDVYQTPSEIVIKSTIAGIDPADLDITVTNDMVTIKGKREKDETITQGDYYYQECYWGAFSRSVILPVDVEAEKAEAAMKNGILTIRLPKIEKIKTKKIKVVSH